MSLMRSFVCIAVLCSVGACKKKGGDIESVCASNFEHGEMDNGTWSPGKGDRAKFMEYCTKQDPEVVRCSSMEIDFGDKECEKSTGLRTDGFKVKMKISALRSGGPVPP